MTDKLKTQHLLCNCKKRKASTKSAGVFRLFCTFYNLTVKYFYEETTSQSLSDVMSLSWVGLQHHLMLDDLVYGDQADIVTIDPLLDFSESNCPKPYLQ